MRPFYLRLRAPFAAFRWMQAGVYRATAPVIPHSAAWGLVLNLAGVETRAPGEVTTRIRSDAPPLRLAVGRPLASFPGEGEGAMPSVLYQQLHGYPVGNSGEALATNTHGSKFWIAPARREILVDFDAVVAVMSPEDGFEGDVRRGLAGALAAQRYGLPFAGDNNLLFDHIEVVEPLDTRWYARVQRGDGTRAGACRLTVSIDRDDSSRTRSELFAPEVVASLEPPASAWVWTPRAPANG